MGRNTTDTRPFAFRQFQLFHHQSTMKVGIDATILGIWAQTNDMENVLDVGCGSGIVSLLLASRAQCFVTAIDIDKPSVAECATNFHSSPFKDRLSVQHISLQQFSEQTNHNYDHVVSNPPFFQNSLLPHSERLRLAKHNIALTMPQFVENVKRLLTYGGKWAVILPIESFDSILRLATASGFLMTNRLNVIPKTGKPVKRIAVVFCRLSKKIPESENLEIRDEDGKYSKTYKFLTQDYHAEGYL